MDTEVTFETLFEPQQQQQLYRPQEYEQNYLASNGFVNHQESNGFYPCLNTPIDQRTAFPNNNAFYKGGRNGTVAHSTPNHNMVASIMDVSGNAYNYSASLLSASPTDLNNLNEINNIVTNDRVNNPIETADIDKSLGLEEYANRIIETHEDELKNARVDNTEPPSENTQQPLALVVDPSVKAVVKAPMIAEKKPRKDLESGAPAKKKVRSFSIGKRHLTFEKNNANNTSCYSSSSSSSSESDNEMEKEQVVAKTKKTTSKRKYPFQKTIQMPTNDDGESCDEEDESCAVKKPAMESIIVRRNEYDNVSSCAASSPNRSDAENKNDSDDGDDDETVPEGGVHDSSKSDYTEDQEKPEKQLKYRNIEPSNQRQKRKLCGKYNKESRATIVPIPHLSSQTSEDDSSLEQRENSHKINEMLKIDRRVFEGRYDMSRRFVDFYTSKMCHMFLITEPNENGNDKFELRYINTVHSVMHEYKTYHVSNGNSVIVLTLNRYKFLIVEQLLDAMNMPVPLAERIDAPKQNEVSFTDIKDNKYISLLVKHFDLDTVIAQTELMFLYSAMDRNKGKYVHNKLTNLVEDNTLFSLPVNVSRKEAANAEDEVQNICNSQESKYVKDIVYHAQTIHFNQVENVSRYQPQSYYKYIDRLKEEISIWLPAALTNYRGDIKKKRDFTYKYGSVARIFFSSSDSDILKQVRKEKGGRFLVENYLQCNREDTTDSFILIDTKQDERLTIVKKGLSFIWLNSIHTDIKPADIIDKFKFGTHHVLSLNKNTRKEVNARHNGLIKLIAHFTSGALKINHVVMLAKEFYKIKHQCIEYKDNKLQPARPEVVVEKPYEFVDVFSDEYKIYQQQQQQQQQKPKDKIVKMKIKPKKIKST
ncbi:IE-1 [Alphabaculovirus altermyunipunctae]|uniref:IE-1 n=1 Tax=Mythimna unipuncta nucleopolyhedrovirus TaxID=447897 RepID=A0A346TPF2_9ABAC|nr:IE-1 [Mythimna unipuncta nucleopolyhedrovirus]AXU41462.1 IE-1 [Mythimna unipuncta nucleopolyhedrovirus]